MSEYEYEEENLDEFMIKSSQILISENNNDEKDIIIESLKQHLSSIFNNKAELQNFYKTLNMVIFSDNSNKIINKECFKIFPLVFSFNPNSCFYYIDFYLFSINQSIKEENKSDFAFLGLIFSEVITSVFSDKNTNKYLISNEYLLDENKKYKLYEKLFNFLIEKIKSTDKIIQSFGCLLLTELIEKCPIIKEQKYLEEIFKLLSKYLEDKKFQCKLDILNCLISLIFITEQKFKPYANLCLLRVLDYLTNDQWIMRKLSINIVYTLVFFCKNEILSVKDNIIEFLNILKEDPVKEIKEVCQQTLKLLEDEENINEDYKENGNNIINNNAISSDDKVIENKEKIENDIVYENKNKNKNENETHINKDKKLNKFINKNNNHINNTDRKNKSKVKRINNKNENYNKNKSDKNIIGNRNKKSILNYNTKNQNKINKTPNRYKTKQESKDENMTNMQTQKDKDINQKSKFFNTLGNADTNNNSANKNKQSIDISDDKNKILDEINTENEKDNKDIINSIENINYNNKYDMNLIEKEDEKFENVLSNIMGQLGKIQEGQTQFLNMINDLQTKLSNNYDNLNERITMLENNYNNDSTITIKSAYAKNHNTFRINNNKKVKSSNYEELKNKFRLGKYNDALNEAINNEKNLFKLIPLIDKSNITKINNEIMEDVINILNKKLILINLDNGRTILSDILSFYLCIIKAKIPLKLISQLNIKDSLVMLKNKNIDRLLQIDINNIDAIVKSLKV